MLHGPFLSFVPFIFSYIHFPWKMLLLIGQRILCEQIVGSNPEEQQKMFGRHFEMDDELVSHISRRSIDILKANYRVRFGSQLGPLFIDWNTRLMCCLDQI